MATHSTEGKVPGELVDEAIARAKIQTWVEEELGKKRSFWDVLNAPFSLWLMTSVIVAGAAFGFEKVSTAISENGSRIAQVAHIKTELTYRLEPAVVDALYGSQNGGLIDPSFISAACNSPAVHRAVVSPAYSVPTVPIGVPPPNEREKELLAARFIYPEYENRSISSLLWELEELESDQAADDSIRAARDAIDALRAAALNGTVRPFRILLQHPNQSESWWQAGPRTPQRYEEEVRLAYPPSCPFGA